MSQLTFPIHPDGLIVDVLVNYQASLLLKLRGIGQPCPPIQTRGIIDTGSNISGISQSLLNQLGIQSIGTPQVTTGIGGQVRVEIYRVSLHLREAANLNLPMFTQPSLVVMELPADVPWDVLIGMDVLINCKLVVDDPAGLFRLDF